MAVVVKLVKRKCQSYPCYIWMIHLFTDSNFAHLENFQETQFHKTPTINNLKHFKRIG